MGSTQYYSIDRIEDNVAVLQDDEERVVNVDVALLPSDAVAGDIVRQVDGRYEHDREETQTRRDRIVQLEQRLRGKRKDADV